MSIISFGSVKTSETVVKADLLNFDGPVLRRFFGIGGKNSNRAIASAKEGIRTYLVGALGDDEAGHDVVSKIASQSGLIDTSLIKYIAGSKTPCSMVLCDTAGGNRVVTDASMDGALRSDFVPGEILREAKVLTMEMTRFPEEHLKLAKRARQAETHVLLNLTKNLQFRPILEFVDTLVVNQAEWKGLASVLGIQEEAHPVKAAAAIAAHTNGRCVITLGDEGAVAADRAGNVWSARSENVEIVDTAGAGDAFCGALAAAIHENCDFETALKVAVDAGCRACTVANGFYAEQPFPITGNGSAGAGGPPGPEKFHL